MALPISLSQLSADAGAETSRRVEAGTLANGMGLQSTLALQQGQVQGDAEAQQRDQTFQRAQAMLAEALARREEAMREVEQRARQTFDEQQASLQRTFLGNEAALDRTSETNMAQARRAAEVRDAQRSGGGYAQPDWFTQQRFQTDENIRQAKALGEMERYYKMADQGDEAKAGMPRLTDFGDAAINPYRGQALLEGGYKQLSSARMGAAQKYLEQADYDPNRFIQILREHKWDPKKASIAMWNLLGGTV